MDNLKSWLLAYIKTFKMEDVNVVGITCIVTAIGKICSGVLPIVALVVAVYQLRIQAVRLRTERLRQVQTCDEIKEELKD